MSWDSRYIGMVPQDLINTAVKPLITFSNGYAPALSKTHGGTTMKITIKAKPEPVHQFKLRIPESLKALIDVNRKLADSRGADYNATAVEAFTRFNHDFNAQLTSSA